MKIKLFILAAILISMLANTCVFANKVSLIQNAGFEEDSSGQPAFWSKYDWENKQGVSEFKLDDTQRYSGNRSVCIISNSPNDARYIQAVKVKGNTYYRLSCWIRTDNVGLDNKGANLSVENILDTSREIKGTSTAWENVELYGKTDNKQETFTITLGLGGYGSLNLGKAWFDDVEVQKLTGLPQGKTAVNFYPPGAGTTTTSSKETSVIPVVFILISIIFVILLLFYIRKARKTPQTSGTSGKKTTPAKTSVTIIVKLVLDRKDIIIMAAMTMVYLMIALINLGSLSAPKTSWKPVKPGESFIVNLGREVSISRIYYNSGIGKGAYRLEYTDNLGKLQPLASINPNNFDDFYRWRYLNVSAKSSRIKITVESPGAVLNEIGIFESESAVPFKSLKIEEKNTDPSDDGWVENLFDEQQTISYNPSFMNSTYFDEIYHARTAYEHLNRLEPYESTHPPLGKLLISLGILVFGMDPFGWRIVGTLFGAAMIPAMYIFGRKMFAKRFYAFCTAFLMMFDFMHFTQTRIATIDVYVTFFIILMFYYVFDYYVNKSYVLGFKQSLKPLFLSGLFFGLGAASKWIALYGAAGLALLFLLTKYDEYRDYIRTTSIKKAKKIQWINDFIPLYINGTLLFCILFFIIIPGIIYILSYIPFMMVPGPGHDLNAVFSYQAHMYSYHKNLVATHPFSSSWWQWPIMTKPLWAYGGGQYFNLPANKVSSIFLFGNPAVWWTGIFSALASLLISIRKHDRKMVVVFVAIASQYLPWILVPRLTFIYHYFSIVPFMILTIVYVIKNILEKYPRSRYAVYVYLVIVAVLFIWFYPVLSGMEVDRSYIEHLKWFGTWMF